MGKIEKVMASLREIKASLDDMTLSELQSVRSKFENFSADTASEGRGKNRKPLELAI